METAKVIYRADGSIVFVTENCGRVIENEIDEAQARRLINANVQEVREDD